MSSSLESATVYLVSASDFLEISGDIHGESLSVDVSGFPESARDYLESTRDCLKSARY